MIVIMNDFYYYLAGVDFKSQSLETQDESYVTMVQQMPRYRSNWPYGGERPNTDTKEACRPVKYHFLCIDKNGIADPR